MKRTYPHSFRFLAQLLFGALASWAQANEGVVSQPFGLRSQPSAATMFTELPQERTGLITTNRYDDPRMWGERHNEYNVGAIGTGVTVGDFDRDGRPDVFVVSKIESGRLFRNLGDWRFEDVTATAGLEDDSGEWKQGAAAVDVDNDGWLDLYVCRFGAPNQLFINQGDGTFRDEAAERGVAVVDASGMACFADYDRDGWLDFYLQTNLLDAQTSLQGQPDRLFRNNGDGTFTEVTAAAGISAQPTQGHSATWWDHNGDGWLDLYVADDFAPPDFLYRNNGDGTFTNVIDTAVSQTPFSSMGADLGDINNDGHLDLFVADMAGTTYEFTQRGLADTRAKLDPGRNELRDVAVQVLNNTLFLGTGTARSLEVAHLTGLEGTDWTWSPRFEDLDQDGRVDLFVTNGMDREHNNLDFIVKKLTAVNVTNRIRITKARPVLRQRNLAYVNRGDLQFEEVGAAWGLDKLGVSFGAALADFDGDGDLDIIHTNFEEGATVLRNDGQGGSAATFAFMGRASNRDGWGVRVEATTAAGTQVRQMISARGYLSTSGPTVHFGLGDADTIQHLRVIWPSGVVQELTDLAAGHHYVISEPNPTENAPSFAGTSRATSQHFREASAELGLAVSQREEKLEGTVSQPLLPFRFNRRGPVLAVGDLSGEGTDEVLLGGTVLDGLRLHWATDGAFQTLNVRPLGEPPPLNHGPLVIFDANGDGANDLLMTIGGAALPAEEPEYEPQLWLNRGNGGLDPAPPGFLPSLPISVGAAAAADFNRDGRLDLFLGGRLYPGYYPEPAMSALLLQQENRLADATDSFAAELREPGLVTGAITSDVDNDGWIDLIVTLEWGGVRFFRNQAGQGLRDESSDWGFNSAGTGLWSAITAADFNRDGRMDYVVGNLGLNTLFDATEDRPLQLFVHDFAGAGEPQLVLAFHDADRLVPLLSRDELAAKIRTVRRGFRSNDRYAAATLQDILGEDALAAAETYAATELRSGVLLSQPDGRFQFEALPPLAQVAPVQSMVTADFDADGFMDLLIANNSHAPVPSVGRFDNGLGVYLRGEGDGGFVVVPPEESGWIVPGAARIAALADLNADARPDVLVSRNAQTTLSFVDETQQVGKALAVRLQGTGGNAQAIGARVELLVDGTARQVVEIRADASTHLAFFTVPTMGAGDVERGVRWPYVGRVIYPVPETGGPVTIRR